MATFTTYGPQVVGGFTRYGTQTVVDFGGVVVIAPSSLNDMLMVSLNAYTGALGDRLFKYLRTEGHTGALPDMIYKAGGWEQVLQDLGI